MLSGRQQMKKEEELQKSRLRRGGILESLSPQLWEELNLCHFKRRQYKAPELIPRISRGRGRGLRSPTLSPEPQVNPSYMGIGRAKSRSPYLHSESSLCVPHSWPRCLSESSPNVPQTQLSTFRVRCLLWTPSMESVISAESGYKADLD